MAVDIVVPNAGESVSEAILGQWRKKDGEYAAKGEVVAVLESDKAGIDVVAAEAGTVRTAAAEGQTVAIGAVIGKIEPGASPAGAAAPAKAAEPVKAVAGNPATAPAATGTGTAVASSPSARILAQDKGIDLAQLQGSGRGGRVTKEDVAAPPKLTTPAPAPTVQRNGTPASPRETRQRMSSIRARIAARLLESQQTTASLTTFNEVDMTAVNELRAKYKDKFKERHGVGLGFSSFFIKAVVEALKAFPIVNARIDGPEIVHQHFYDIGMAVSTEKGLMVPVLRGCDGLSFAGIEKAVGAVAAKARDNKITVDDLQGGTFTITNGGVFGSLLSTPILNPPQTAILGMHAIQKRAVVLPDDRIVARPMMYLALTYDHRLIDGKDAVQFLVKIKDGVENPERLMLEL